MILFADENIERQIVERLREDGHEVLYVAEFQPSISDSVVLARANEKNALLVTADKDFGELVFRRNLATVGVILVRLPGLPANTKAEIVSGVLSQHARELPTAFTVITAQTVRIRPR